MSHIAQHQPGAVQSSNEDSSGRTRSGSFSSHDARRPTIGNSSRSGMDTPKSSQDETRIMFHRELMETCADLMSRYTYGNCAPYAQQSDTLTKLLKVSLECVILVSFALRFNAFFFFVQEGSSQTWLVGHKLVTVTTSPCSRVATQRGLCDRCSLLCRLGMEETPTLGDLP